MIRLLHTADWHLGHTLHDQPRIYEHERFLAWLLEVLEAEAVDALVVAGDVFETSNPSAQAQRRWYEFLALVRRRCPELQVVVIGGNHDSAARLEAPTPLLAAFGMHMVGGASHGKEGPPLDRLLVPLRAGGEVRAWLCAVPFLRPADLPAVPHDDPFVAGVAAFYEVVVQAARERRRSGQAIVAAGHLYVSGSRPSELSERRILAGHQHALPAEIFPPDLAYVALGHLHQAQTVAGREGVRYSGSPIPLSMAEADYAHQVLLVDLNGEQLESVRPMRVPRTVELLRVPMEGPAPLEPVLEMLERLEVDPPSQGAPPALLEVRVQLERPRPDLRERIERAIEGKAVRLVKITREHLGDGRSLAEAEPRRALADLDFDEVFRRCWARRHPDEPPTDILAAYHEVVEEAARELEEARA